MNRLYLSSSQLTESFPDFFSKGYEVISGLGGRLLTLIQPAVRPLANQMQKSRKVAIVVFTIANIIFLPALHYLTRQKSESEPEANPFSKVIKPLFVEVVLVGGGVIAYNALLSKVMDYRLSRRALTWIAIAALSFRFVCRKLFTPSDHAKEPETAKKPPETTPENKPPVKIQNSPVQDSTKSQQKCDIPKKNIKLFADYIQSIKCDEDNEKEFDKQYNFFISLPEEIKVLKLNFLFAKSLNQYNNLVKSTNKDSCIPASAREMTIKACVTSFNNRTKLQKKLFSNMYSQLSTDDIRKYHPLGFSKK